MDDYEYLYLRHHDPATCATCRTRRELPTVCAFCREPAARGGGVVLCYTSRETPHHLGYIHTDCSALIDEEAADDRYIHY